MSNKFKVIVISILFSVVSCGVWSCSSIIIHEAKLPFKIQISPEGRKLNFVISNLSASYLVLCNSALPFSPLTSNGDMFKIVDEHGVSVDYEGWRALRTEADPNYYIVLGSFESRSVLIDLSGDFSVRKGMKVSYSGWIQYYKYSSKSDAERAVKKMLKTHEQRVTYTVIYSIPGVILN